jgi:transaldolase
MNALARLLALNPQTELWLDSSPMILDSPRWAGKLDALKPLFSGVTTNPPLSWQVLQERPEHFRKRIAEIKAQDLPRGEKFFRLYASIIAEGAAGLGRGFLSGQVDNRDSRDTGAMLAFALRLRALAPNIMVKMPATAEGIAGIERLSALGIPTNATLTFSLSQVLAVAEAVKRGLAEARKNGVDLAGFRSVVTLMLGRLEDSRAFKAEAEAKGESLSEEERRWAGLAAFKKALRLFQERGYESKLLAASMRKGPGTAIWHLEKLAGAPVVLTVFPDILEAFLNGYAGAAMESRISEEVPAPILEKLLRYETFRKAYHEDGLGPEGWPDFGPVAECAQAFDQAAVDMESLFN